MTTKKAKPAKQRIINPWRTPEKLMMKCFATALYDEGLRGAGLYGEFASMVPAVPTA